jgi:hypothetical protein
MQYIWSIDTGYATCTGYCTRTGASGKTLRYSTPCMIGVTVQQAICHFALQLHSEVHCQGIGSTDTLALSFNTLYYIHTVVYRSLNNSFYVADCSCSRQRQIQEQTLGVMVYF